MRDSVFTVGDVVGERYEVLRQLGRGGYAAVYEARDQKSQARVALKVLLAEHGGDSDAVARFKREAKITSALAHPNIARTFGLSTTAEGQPFMVMELLEGQDLARLRASGTRIPATTAVEIIAQAARGLKAAHDKGYIHRDLKPENVFVAAPPGEGATGRPTVKILDFGATRRAGAATRLTATGLAIGTPEYMSPEQATGADTLDHRTDQFSLAVLAYELLTGRLPFEAPDVVAMLRMIVEGEAPAFAGIGVQLPDGVERAISKAMSKAPEQRFADVTAFADALQAAAAPLGNSDMSCLTTKRPLGRKQKLILMWLAALCLGGAATCFWVVARLMDAAP